MAPQVAVELVWRKGRGRGGPGGGEGAGQGGAVAGGGGWHCKLRLIWWGR